MMHVAHVGAHADALRRRPEALLVAWPALLEQARAVVQAGVRVTIVQAAAEDALLERDGVELRFVRVRSTHSGAARIARAVQVVAPDAIHLQGIRFPLHVYALRRACPRIPLLAQDHADAVPARLRALLERPLLAGLDAVLYATAEQARPMLRSGALPARVMVHEAAAASSAFMPGDRDAAARAIGVSGCPCIAWVGRLARVKDPITALEAFRLVLPHLPHARLWCAFGAAPLRRDVEHYLAAHSHLRERVTLLGELARADVERLLRAADIIIASSRSESTGFALIEALACGATPVTTDIPAFRALTDHEAIGRLFPVGDAAAGAAALIAAAGALDRAAVRLHFERYLSEPALGRRLHQAYATQLERRRNGHGPARDPALARVTVASAAGERGPGTATAGAGRLRVCLLVPGGVDRSGTHRVIPCVLALIERLAREVDLHVLALRQAVDHERYELLGATVHCVPSSSRTAAVRWILQQHRRTGFDVLHALWMHPQGTAAAFAGSLVRRPVLLHVNGGDMAALPDIRFGGRATLPGRLRLRAALAGAAHVTVPSAALVAVARTLGVRAERLTLGVPLDRWPAGAQRPRRAGEPLRLLSVGSLNTVKDHATLLRAVALLLARGVPVRLLCVGEDTQHGAAQRLAVELAIAHAVEFAGFVPHAELRARFRAAHALVVSSRFEADPVAALEAAIAGAAVVGTAVGHLLEWSGSHALTCAPRDAAALADVVGAIAEDDGLRLRLAAAAQRSALQHDADAAAARVLAIYHSLAQHARV